MPISEQILLDIAARDNASATLASADRGLQNLTGNARKLELALQGQQGTVAQMERAYVQLNQATKALDGATSQLTYSTMKDADTKKLVATLTKDVTDATRLYENAVNALSRTQAQAANYEAALGAEAARSATRMNEAAIAADRQRLAQEKLASAPKGGGSGGGGGGSFLNSGNLYGALYSPAGLALLGAGAAANQGLQNDQQARANIAQTSQNPALLASNEKVTDALLKLYAIYNRQQIQAAELTIESVGFTDPKSLQAITGQSLKGSFGAGVDPATYANVLTSVLSEFHLTADKAENVSNAINQAVAVGKLTGQQVATGLGTFGGAAAASGVSYQDALALFAQQSLVSGSPQQSAADENHFYTAIRNLTQKQRSNAAYLGLDTSAQHLQEVGLPAYIAQLQTRIGSDPRVLNQLFDPTTAGVLNSALGKNFSGYQGLAGALQNDQGVAQKGYDIVANGPEAQLTAAFNQMKDSVEQAASALVKDLLPAILGTVKDLGTLGNDLQSLLKGPGGKGGLGESVAGALQTFADFINPASKSFGKIDASRDQAARERAGLQAGQAASNDGVLRTPDGTPLVRPASGYTAEQIAKYGTPAQKAAAGQTLSPPPPPPPSPPVRVNPFDPTAPINPYSDTSGYAGNPYNPNLPLTPTQTQSAAMIAIEDHARRDDTRLLPPSAAASTTTTTTTAKIAGDVGGLFDAAWKAVFQARIAQVEGIGRTNSKKPIGEQDLQDALAADIAVGASQKQIQSDANALKAFYGTVANQSAQHTRLLDIQVQAQVDAVAAQRATTAAQQKAKVTAQTLQAATEAAALQVTAANIALNAASQGTNLGQQLSASANLSKQLLGQAAVTDKGHPDKLIGDALTISADQANRDAAFRLADTKRRQVILANQLAEQAQFSLLQDQLALAAATRGSNLHAQLAALANLTNLQLAQAAKADKGDPGKLKIDDLTITSQAADQQRQLRLTAAQKEYQNLQDRLTLAQQEGKGIGAAQDAILRDMKAHPELFTATQVAIQAGLFKGAAAAVQPAVTPFSANQPGLGQLVAGIGQTAVRFGGQSAEQSRVAQLERENAELRNQLAVLTRIASAGERTARAVEQKAHGHAGGR